MLNIKHNFHTSFIITFAILYVAAIGIIAYFVYQSNNNYRSRINRAQSYWGKLAQQEWKTYTAAEWGIKFDYPQDWQPRVTDNRSIYVGNTTYFLKFIKGNREKDELSFNNLDRRQDVIKEQQTIDNIVFNTYTRSFQPSTSLPPVVEQKHLFSSNPPLSIELTNYMVGSTYDYNVISYPILEKILKSIRKID